MEDLEGLVVKVPIMASEDKVSSGKHLMRLLILRMGEANMGVSVGVDLGVDLDLGVDDNNDNMDVEEEDCRGVVRVKSGCFIWKGREWNGIEEDGCLRNNLSIVDCKD